MPKSSDKTRYPLKSLIDHLVLEKIPNIRFKHQNLESQYILVNEEYINVQRNSKDLCTIDARASFRK